MRVRVLHWKAMNLSCLFATKRSIPPRLQFMEEKGVKWQLHTSCFIDAKGALQHRSAGILATHAGALC